MTEKMGKKEVKDVDVVEVQPEVYILLMDSERS